MRCFISIDMPKNIQSKIKEIQNKLPEFKGKITETENLHLTLKFLGEIDEEKIKEVKEILSKIRVKSFDTEIKELGVFAENFIRIIWLHLTNCGELQEQVDRVLDGLFKKEKRFMGHLTIARVKNVNIPKVRFKVDNFRFKSSVLGEEGPIYETLEEYNLG